MQGLVQGLTRLLVLGYLSYLAISLLVVLPALNFGAPWYVKKTFDRELHSQLLLFNPFTLALVARQVELPEHDGQRFVGFNYAEINLSLASLWQQGLVFDEITVDSLYVHVKRLSAEQFNFSDMLPTADSDHSNSPAEPSSQAIPGITVHHLALHSERIEVTDLDRPTPFATHWDGLAIAVDNLSTVLAPGRAYNFVATAESGGSLQWEGDISVPGASSAGRFSLTKLSLHPLGRFVQPWMNFELKQGYLDLAGQYSLNWQDGFSYQVRDARASLSQFQLAPKTSVELADTALNFSALTADGIEIDGDKQTLAVDTVTLQGLDLSGWSEGEKISLATLFDTANLPTNPPSAGDNSSDSDWQIAIGQLDLSETRIRWQSEYTQPALLEISPLNLSVHNIQWPASSATQAELELAVNQQAKLKLSGELALDSGNGEIHYALEDLPVAWFSPNLPAALNARIGSGDASAEGELQLQDFAPASLKMNGGVSNFSVVISDTENALTQWKSVHWVDLIVDLTEHRVVLNKLYLDNYSGRLHIFEDGTINTQRILLEQVEANAAEEAVSAEPTQPWSVSVPAVYINDSKLDFMDESLPISFRTVIGDLNGEITGFSTEPDSQTTVDIKGTVDGYAPVIFSGTARPLASQPSLDLGLSFEGVDLARLTPYSGTYAGYAIDRGVLNLDLNYRLDNNQLEGHNNIVIAQIKLGEKIDSDKAVDLPLGLAIALLSDSNGVIDLAVPVSGDLDDPEFALGSIIAGALFNLITKAVTAPFTLLASLVGDDQDLQRVNFPAGSADLDEMASGKLTNLAAALTQRPKLQLIISGRLHPMIDREKLQKNALDAQMIAAGVSSEDIATKNRAWLHYIESNYKNLPSDGVEDPSLPHQYQRLWASIDIPRQQMLDLAQERAVAVKRFLVVEVGLDADRAVIDKVELEAEQSSQQFSGVEMELDG